MKFFRNANMHLLTRRIVGEMINIMFGETYFDENGNILSEKKPNHNSYIIDSVEYQVTPNIGFIHVIGTDDLFNTLASTLEDSYKDLIGAVTVKFGLPRLQTAEVISTQYLTVTNTTNGKFPEIKIVCSAQPLTDLSTFTTFVWNIIKGNVPVSNYTKKRRNVIYSLSSIVVDTTDSISLPDGYKHCDFPSYLNYTKGTSLHIEPIDYHPSYGIHRELVKHYDDVEKPKKKQRFSIICRPVYLAKWEWLKLYSINPDSNISRSEQIKMGLFDTEPNEEVTYRCFITNAPIYDDCYVFDIKSRIVVEVIDEKCLQDYPNAQVIDDTYVNPPTEEETPNTKPKKKTKPIKAATPQIIKRGTQTTIKTIKIKYTKHYDTPRCILVSPYYAHLMDSIDPVREFEYATDTQVVVYRTKSPISTLDAIKYSNAPAITKKILELLYNSAYITAAKTLRCSDNNITFRYDQLHNITSEVLIAAGNNITTVQVTEGLED